MAALKEHGLGFKAPMVRAILAGQKSQTRRAVKAQSAECADVWADNGDGTWSSGWRGDGGNLATLETVRAPHGPVGRRLYVKETWANVVPGAGCEHKAIPDGPESKWYTDRHHFAGVRYRATWDRANPRGWKPSTHMPRWASRITLEVTRVRVERVGDISEEDARAEGVSPASVAMGMDVVGPYWSHIAGFRELWCEIEGNASWDANPWVWVYDFRRVG